MFRANYVPFGAKAALYLLAADVTATLRPFLIRAEKELAAMRPRLENDILQKARELGFDVAPDCPQILAIGCLHGHIARVIQQGASVGNRPSDVLAVLGFSLQTTN